MKGLLIALTFVLATNSWHSTTGSADSLLDTQLG